MVMPSSIRGSVALGAAMLVGFASWISCGYSPKGQPKEDLDAVVSTLETEEGKKQFRLLAVQKGVTHDPNYIDEFLDEAGNLVDYRIAFKIAQEMGPEKEVDFHIKQDDIVEAALVASRAGLQERAQNLYMDALAQFGDPLPWSAMPLLRTFNVDVTEIINLYVRNGFVKEAAMYAEDMGLTHDAIDLYEQGQFYHDAFAAATREGLQERADDLLQKGLEWYEKEERFEDAGHIAQAAGLTQSAQINFSTMLGKCVAANNHYCAGRAAEKLGLVDSALEHFEKAGQFITAARYAAANNKPQEAVRYQKVVEVLDLQ